MHKGHITGRRKNFNKKNSKLKVWHSFRKNTLNHTSGTQKSVFFNFVFWEVFLYAVSTYYKLYFSLTKFLYTLMAMFPTRLINSLIWNLIIVDHFHPLMFRYLLPAVITSIVNHISLRKFFKYYPIPVVIFCLTIFPSGSS